MSALTQEHFDTYAPEKWSSNVHNLPRMRTKDVLLKISDATQAGLDDVLTGLSRASSHEVPNIMNQKKVDAQWVYWFRGAQARANLTSFLEKIKLDASALFNTSTQDKHVNLAIILRQTSLDIITWLASGATVDRRNLSMKLSKSWERDTFLEILHALPNEAQIFLGAEATPTPHVTAEQLEALEERALKGSDAISFGFSLSPAAAQELGGDLPAHLQNYLAALAPVYRFIAWSRENDHIDANKKIQEEKAQKRRQATSYHKGDKVRIIGGLFSGKVGIVQEMDTKANVKVQVGKMSVTVPGTDLTPVR